MRPVARDELLELGAYEAVRERFRARILADKRARYVPLGDNMTLLFENHDTVLFQVQEMLRTERITQEGAIAHELATYNELVPGPGELSATVFIEYPDSAERERMMVRLVGIEDKFYLAIDGVRARLVPDTRGTDPSRTMAVHYVKFVIGEAGERALSRGGVSVVLGVEHPEYRAEIALPSQTLASLRADLG
ncbi:MAG: DUF3501 family protein [Myxococcota bacterium]|jgi:Protein of unknown function (DUF3501)|nr:DUF3501 family protein [Myxococcota bacterium]